jgi:hypothetical protein
MLTQPGLRRSKERKEKNSQSNKHKFLLISSRFLGNSLMPPSQTNLPGSRLREREIKRAEGN